MSKVSEFVVLKSITAESFNCFRFLRVFVAVIQTVLRGSADRMATISSLKPLPQQKICSVVEIMSF